MTNVYSVKPKGEQYLIILIKITLCAALIFLLFPSALCHAREIALTFDDAPTPDSALMTGKERSRLLINALQDAKVPDVLFFVKADGINKSTQERLNQYAAAGFHIANHSYSHQSAGFLGVTNYMADVKSAHLLLKNQRNFLPFHRFPYLNCGKDKESVLSIRDSLSELGYEDGYITVASYDWHMSALLAKTVENNKKIHYDKAKKFYVDTLYNAIEFYDGIATKTLGRSPKHVLLLHENDAAALFVDDLVAHLRAKGWKIITPQEAYKDPIARKQVNASYHLQNRLSAIASHEGFAEAELHDVSENTDYLENAFNSAEIAF